MRCHETQGIQMARQKVHSERKGERLKRVKRSRPTKFTRRCFVGSASCPPSGLYIRRCSLFFHLESFVAFILFLYLFFVLAYFVRPCRHSSIHHLRTRIWILDNREFYSRCCCCCCYCCPVHFRHFRRVIFCNMH